MCNHCGMATIPLLHCIILSLPPSVGFLMKIGTLFLALRTEHNVLSLGKNKNKKNH